MAGLKVKLDGKQYAMELDPSELTLGELSFLQDHYGLADIREWNPLEPKQAEGSVAIALRRGNPDLPLAEVLTKAGGLKYKTYLAAFDKQAEEEEKRAANPPKAPAKGGARGKRPEPPGTQP